MKKQGSLIISLDFELLWGIFDKVDYKDKIEYFQNTRNVIPRILNLFDKFEISCTWATVGMLFNHNWEEWSENFPAVLPAYHNRAFSAYEYGSRIKSTSTVDFCFAPDLIDKIIQVPGQEIATHTYSHYYCLEGGQTPEAFKADLELSIKLALDKGITLRSLVFPRNQYNFDYLKICHELGIRNVRSNPENWYWIDTQKDSLQQKFFRTGDAYIGIKDKSYKPTSLKKEDGVPLSQKASRLLRPYSSNKILNTLKLKRIFSEMDYAAKNGEIYHLWWHPHNFGNNPEENINDLSLILEHYKILKDQYDFRSMNMDEIYLSLEK